MKVRKGVIDVFKGLGIATKTAYHSIMNIVWLYVGQAILYNQSGVRLEVGLPARVILMIGFLSYYILYFRGKLKDE